MNHTLNRASRSRAAGGGLLAGIFGGIVLYAIHIGMSLNEGRDFWPIVKGPALWFLGEQATAPGFDLVPVLLGGGIHFGISMLWGLMFSILFYGATKIGTLTLGAAWGIVSWLVMFYLVLPLTGLTALTRATPLEQAALEHVIFGVAIAIAFLPYQPRRRFIDLDEEEVEVVDEEKL
jgi:hypothetical protein